MLGYKIWRIVATLLLLGCDGGERAELETGAGGAVANKQLSEKPSVGDWLLIHSLSDPEQLNPLTSNDAAASSILQYIVQGLLTRDPRTLELKPLIAAERPSISADKLSYTFPIRRDVHFQDGRPLTAEDVLFSIK